jgi:hypothetical protein
MKLRLLPQDYNEEQLTIRTNYYSIVNENDFHLA